VGRPEGKNHFGDLGVDGIIILKWISKKWEGMNVIDLAQNTNRWETLVTSVMNFRAS
jgi:hypothetical protein